MTYLDPIWQQGALESLLATFDVDDHQKRDMIQFLLDEGFWDKDRLNWPSAVARFNACLNPNKAEFFKLSEVWALMKRFNRHQLALAIIEDLGYERPQLVPTEARKLALLEEIKVAVENCDRTLSGARAEIARLEQTAQDARRLHPSVAQGGAPRFSLAEAEPPGPGNF